MSQPGFRPKQDGPFGTLERPGLLCYSISAAGKVRSVATRTLELGTRRGVRSICRQFLVLCGATALCGEVSGGGMIGVKFGAANYGFINVTVFLSSALAWGNQTHLNVSRLLSFPTVSKVTVGKPQRRESWRARRRPCPLA